MNLYHKRQQLGKEKKAMETKKYNSRGYNQITV